MKQRMLLPASVFFVLFVAALGLDIVSVHHWYGVSLALSMGAWALIIFSYPFLMLLERKRSTTLTRSLLVMGGFFLGLFLLATLAAFVSWLLWPLAAPQVSYPVLTGIFIILSLIMGRRFVIRRVSLPVKGLKKPTRLVLVSDLHVGSFHRERFLSRLAKAINEQAPDVTVMAGDVFDGSGDPHEGILSPLKAIRSPVLAVLGNHDQYLGAERSQRLMEREGITVLRGAAKTVKGLRLVGTDCPLSGSWRDPAPSLRRLKAPGKEPLILLYHIPLGFQDARRLKPSLMLCGHTHQGQFFPLGVFVRILFRYSYGLYRLEGMPLYVSSGVGSWGPPMRFFTKAEIVVFELHKA